MKRCRRHFYASAAHSNMIPYQNIVHFFIVYKLQNMTCWISLTFNTIFMKLLNSSRLCILFNWPTDTYENYILCDIKRIISHRVKNAILTSLITSRCTWEMFVGGSDNTPCCVSIRHALSHRAENPPA